VGHEAAVPAFDAPVAVGTAMLQVGLATMTPAAQSRRDAASMPRTATPPRQEPSVAVELTARPATPESVSPRDAASTAPMRPVPSTPPVVTPVLATPVLATLVPTPSASSPARVEVAAAVATVTLAQVPSPPALPITAELVQPPALPMPQPPRMQVEEERAAPSPSPVLPITVVEPVAAPRMPNAVSAPTDAAPEAAAPAFTIGTVEVVIAQPPRQPAAAPAARPTPDRGFSRYAAMRSGRDRAW
jgi:hypothetical protein